MEKANGKAQKLTQIATSSKEIITVIESMGRACSLGQVETSTKVNTTKMKGREMGKCSGLTGACTKENGAEESSTGLAEWSFLMARQKKDTSRIMYTNMLLEVTIRVLIRHRALKATVHFLKCKIK